jgi:hypothetical protein
MIPFCRSKSQEVPVLTVVTVVTVVTETKSRNEQKTLKIGVR